MDQIDLNPDFFQYYKENNGSIKKETDFLQVENFNTHSIQTPSSYTFPNTLDATANLNNRMPLDLSNLRDLGNLCKLEVMKNEVPFLVKYKLQDGKHVKIWQCKTCLKEFGHQYTLMRHLPTHTDERKFQCNTCGKGNLRNHIFTHTNERPYKCDDCGKGYNQMSNLMCHKLKSHQRVDKPNHSCQVCGRIFAKRIALRNHEQYEHRTNNLPMNSNFLTEDQNRIANAIYVEPIKTKAMQLAIESNQIPFALLRPLTGIPVLVRVLPAGNDKQMLVPASAEDLKKHGQISVTPKTSETATQVEHKQNLVGSTVQIKIPVVATVIQQNGEGGHMSMSVVSPGPNDESVKQPSCQSLGTYIFTATSDKKCNESISTNESFNFSSDFIFEEKECQEEPKVTDLKAQDVFIIQ